MSIFRLRSNSKLRKSGIYNFSLPAIQTCPMAGSCKQFCYANKGCYRFRQSKEFHQSSLELTKSGNFIKTIDDELKRCKSIKVVRIHDSGDFYSQEYLRYWVTIAILNPNIQFYCYTKSLHLNWSGALSLANFKRIQSFGGQMDDQIDLSKPHARIFDSLDDLLNAGYTDCSQDDSIAANPETIKIGLIKY
jgi:hypothetical protein